MDSSARDEDLVLIMFSKKEKRYSKRYTSSYKVEIKRETVPPSVPDVF